MKNFKKFTAIALATTMTVGSTVTVFAEGEGDSSASSSEVSSEGTGSYEGGEIQYPAISVTLPTIAAGTYDYVADPNGLIEATKGDDGSAAKDSNSTYTGSTGIFFLTSQTEDGKKTFTENSQAFEVENESAQDVDITVKLEQKTAGDSIIKYADSATFEDTDKENKLYLAITDGAQTDPKTAALTADEAAVITAKVEGVSDNFEAGYNSTSQKYEYTKKTADLADWNSCSFNMTGALNKAATWGDNVTFPEIKVTWSFVEHVEGIEAQAADYDGVLWISVDGSNGFATQPSLVKVNGTATTSYTFDTGSSWISMDTPASGSVIQIIVGDTSYKVVVP